MPSVMGAFDAIINDRINEKNTESYRKRTNNFHYLSPNVQKILSNVPDEEISRKFTSEECLNRRLISHKTIIRSSERMLHKSNENLDIISPNVQKMLSNLPDNEVLLTPNRKVTRNNSYLHDRLNKLNINNNADEEKQSDNNSDVLSERLSGDVDDKSIENSYNHKPLGSFLHTSPNGITSRTPVGRKNLGKFLQVCYYCISI